MLAQESRELIKSRMPVLRRREPLEATIHTRDKHGRDRWFHINGTCIDTVSDDPVYLTMFIDITDITELRELQRKLEERTDMLNEALEAARCANAAKSDFLSRMSHDIRTPMNAIIGLTAIAASCADDPDRVIDCMEKIPSSSKLLLSLINEVLDMSKIESGRIVLSEEYFLLDSLFKDVISMIQPDLKRRGHTLNIHIETLEHEAVCGDMQRLQQIINNLLSNAIKYTPHGGTITLELSEARSPQQGYGTYRLVCEDNGVGISPEFIERVFEPFERAEDERIRGVQGTGLGMSIAQGIVSTMQGDIHVESREGEGSCFTVTLNFRIQGKEQEREGGMRDCIRDDDMDCSSLAGRRILLVEDNALNMEIAKAILCEHGLEVDGAENGQEAYERFTSSAPGTYEAVLMDLQMPVMDGCTAARMIRASSHPQARTIPIIALTANAFAEDVAKALTRGLNYHIAKPIDFHQLFHALKQFMTTS